MKKIFLTIDPGLSGTGIISWDTKKSWSKDIIYEDAKLFKPHGKDWMINAEIMSIDIKNYYKNYFIEHIYIEFPQVFQSSLGQAASNRGDILKLAFFIGCIRGVFLDSGFEPILVSKWKGQLPKSETERRCKRILPKILWVNSEHLWDAIGLGLYLKGKI